MNPNQTWQGLATSIDALSDNESFRKNVHVDNPEDMNLIFGPQLAKLAKK